MGKEFRNSWQAGELTLFNPLVGPIGVQFQTTISMIWLVFMSPQHRIVWLLAFLMLASCSGGSSSSGGPTAFAGKYDGTITVAGGFVNTISVTITVDGFVVIDVPGGIVCPGDVPDRIGLDGDSFDITSGEECIVAGFSCPVNTIITGALDSDTVSGSGSVLLGCPNAGGLFNFSFVARR